MAEEAKMKTLLITLTVIAAFLFVWVWKKIMTTEYPDIEDLDPRQGRF